MLQNLSGARIAGMENNYFETIFRAKLAKRTKADAMRHINRIGSVLTVSGSKEKRQKFYLPENK